MLIKYLFHLHTLWYLNNFSFLGNKCNVELDESNALIDTSLKTMFNVTNLIAADKIDTSVSNVIRNINFYFSIRNLEINALIIYYFY
jgi:hypothetical protein